MQNLNLFGSSLLPKCPPLAKEGNRTLYKEAFCNVNKLFINVVVQAPLSYNVWVRNKALQNSAGVRRYSALSQVNCESIVS